MPPLHPALVHFPIALVGFSFITDLLGLLLKKPSLRAAGFWSLIGALLGGAIAAVTGYYDFSRDALGETSRYVDFHMDMGSLSAGWWRSRFGAGWSMPGAISRPEFLI